MLLNAASVCIVSLAALNGSSNEGQVLKGIGFIGGGCFVMACQLVLEEVSMYYIREYVCLIFASLLSTLFSGLFLQSSTLVLFMVLPMMIILLFTSIHACQYISKQAVMAGDDDDADEEGTPPLVVVGMEGFWGSLIMLCVVRMG